MFEEFLLRRYIVFLLLICLCAVQLAVAVDPSHAIYLGGTANITQGTKNVLDVSDANLLKFGAWQIPYDEILALSYGQQLEHHWALLGLGAYGVVPLIAAKKKHHYFTIQYSGMDSKTESAVFEVGKGSIKPVLETVQLRSSKQVVYVDKHPKKGK